MILADPRHEPKVRQGVTTELVGVDGLSYAPFAGHDDLERASRDERRARRRPARTSTFDWSTSPSYLDRFDGRHGLNVATLVGNTPAPDRRARLGRGHPADAAAIADQRAVLREAMEEGAFGLSAGLDYPPGAYATTEELAELANEAAKLGGIYHTHVRYASATASSIRSARRSRSAGSARRRPISPTSITGQTFPGTPDQMLELVDDARAEGQDVTFDLYPYEWASTRLLILVPIWVQDGGPADEGAPRRPGGPRADPRAT